MFRISLVTDAIEQTDLDAEIAGRQVRVSHRHLHRLMTEELTDGSQRRATHDEPRGECVTQVVPSEILDPCVLDGSVEALLQIVNRLTGI